MAEIFHCLNATPVKLVSSSIAYEPAPVIHIDIYEGEQVVAAARIMHPYHGSMLGVEYGKTDQELELEVLTLFSAGSLSLTLGRVIERRQLMQSIGHHEIAPMYQHPAEVVT
ncbi:hypothetical protein ACO0LF_26930 [Undibacterium sp. Di27W]|uniref:hypothetical protein n=1 Tax=Undibacterium sp. Di27W TaxID=3413036 RepID=UPI003BF30B67